MRKRYVILGLSVVLALALAVPAFGGPTNPISKGIASAKKTAKKALKTANAAQATANTALSTAEAAQSGVNKDGTEIKKLQTSVTTAQTTATNAGTAAAAAKAAADSAKSTADSAKSLAEAAKTAAAAAEANANTRLNGSVQVAGETSVSSEGSKFASVACGEGQPTLGGGYVVGGSQDKTTVYLSEKAIYNEGWFVGGQLINGQAGNWTLQAFALCGTK